MKKILTISSNEEVMDTVKNALQKFERYFNGEFLWFTPQIINYINYELPEIKILDYTSEDTDCDTILSTINADPWLHYGGIIAVCETRGKKQTLEELKDSNTTCLIAASNSKLPYHQVYLGNIFVDKDPQVVFDFKYQLLYQFEHYKEIKEKQEQLTKDNKEFVGYNKHYDENQEFVANSVWYTVSESYITNKDVYGNIINKDKDD